MNKNKNNINKFPIPTTCRYCGGPVILTSNAEIYGREYGTGKCYLCRNCNAYVGVHPGTIIPLGTLANKELREMRNKAHNEFDKLWKNKIIKSRYKAYCWLANEMNLKVKETHIGWFEKEQCMRVIELVKKKLNKE